VDICEYSALVDCFTLADDDDQYCYNRFIQTLHNLALVVITCTTCHDYEQQLTTSGQRIPFYVSYSFVERKQVLTKVIK
jgi:hypothetical protein